MMAEIEISTVVYTIGLLYAIYFGYVVLYDVKRFSPPEKTDVIGRTIAMLYAVFALFTTACHLPTTVPLTTNTLPDWSKISWSASAVTNEEFRNGFFLLVAAISEIALLVATYNYRSLLWSMSLLFGLTITFLITHYEKQDTNAILRAPVSFQGTCQECNFSALWIGIAVATWLLYQFVMSIRAAWVKDWQSRPLISNPNSPGYWARPQEQSECFLNRTPTDDETFELKDGRPVRCNWLNKARINGIVDAQGNNKKLVMDFHYLSFRDRVALELFVAIPSGVYVVKNTCWLHVKQQRMDNTAGCFENIIYYGVRLFDLTIGFVYGILRYCQPWWTLEENVLSWSSSEETDNNQPRQLNRDDYGTLCAAAMLESSLISGFTGFKKAEDGGDEVFADGSKIALFRIPSFPVVQNVNVPVQDTLELQELDFACEIKVHPLPFLQSGTEEPKPTAQHLPEETFKTNSEFMSATLGGRTIEDFEDIFLLLVARVSGSQHVEVHARANWGLTPYAKDKWLRWYSKVSIAFNNDGYEQFTTILMALNSSLGLFGATTKEVSFMPTFQVRKRNRIGVQQMFGLALKPTKANITVAMGDVIESCKTLQDFSRFGRFITKLWPEFEEGVEEILKSPDNPFAPGEVQLEELRKLMAEGVDELGSLNDQMIKDKLGHPDTLALFFGTVIHSLDHDNLFKMVTNPFWLKAKSRRWAYIEELIRIVRVGFVGDHVSVFPVFFHETDEKSVSGKFFHDIYEKAQIIDTANQTNFAKFMETCIVK